MSESNWDVLIIGSGAGGASAAFRLVNAGKCVLMLEKGAACRVAAARWT